MGSMPQLKLAPQRPEMSVVQSYVTPPGYRDFPFIYGLDLSSYGTGDTFYDLALRMDGDADFILRRIFGFTLALNNGTGKFRYKNRWGSYAISDPMLLPSPTLGALCDSWPVLPEKLYPAGGAIKMDLLNTNPYAPCTFNGQPVYQPGNLYFQGVKRFPITGPKCFYETPYRYREVPFSYKYGGDNGLVLNWYQHTNGGLNAPQTFQVDVVNYDFELQGITSSYVGESVLTSYTNFQIVLYDSSGLATSNMPVMCSMLQDQNFALINALDVGVFPVPPLIYRVNSKIKFDIYSMVCPGDVNAPYTIDLTFHGVQRVPC
ncbi:MAG: hypothetical protein U0Q18_25315 [Bryobacteraceae bacterium]